MSATVNKSALQFVDPNTLQIPEKFDPRFIEGRTNSKVGVDKLRALLKQHGAWPDFLAPIIVIQEPSFEDPNTLQTTVVAGIRRTLAARAEGVEAKVVYLPPDTPMVEQVGIIIGENEGRTDLDPVAKAASFQAFISAYVEAQRPAGLEPDAAWPNAKEGRKLRNEAVKLLSVNHKLAAGTVDEYLQLLERTDEVKKAVATGQVSRTKVTDRAGWTRDKVLNDDGTPNEDVQAKLLKQLIGDGESKPVTREQAAQAASNTEGAVGYKPAKREIDWLIAAMDEAEAEETELVRNLVAFMRGELTLRTAKKRLPFVKEYFTPKDGPGAADGE